MSYTCSSCSLAFPTSEDQRVHMKSEWHRYNLKRRVAQLPPIDETLFNTKVANLASSEERDNNTKSGKKKHNKQQTKKEVRRMEKEALYERRKELLSEARASLLKKNINESESKPEMESTRAPHFSNDCNGSSNPNTVDNTLLSSDEILMEEKEKNKVDIPINCCLFCHSNKNANFDNVDYNIRHMFKSHGFYIPERKYLVDKEGLLTYLGEKIGLGNICLCCSYQGKNLEAVREHMLSKRHMKVPYEMEDQKLEISEFYDFSSTYGEVTCPIEETDSGAWEDVSSSEDESMEVLSSDLAIFPNGHELKLPSGAVVGHRSLARYYRQNLPLERILSEGQGTVVAAETRHMLNILDRKHVAEQKRSWGRQKKREDVNDRRAAKFINNQPHFRDPLLQ